MKLGIVGSEQAKFTKETEAKAIEHIKSLIKNYNADTIVSGKCHLGGIDIWAVEVATALGIKYIEYPPASLSWPGYRKRNLQIAKTSDIVVCITVRQLPDEYSGIRFEYCYHCKTDNHIKSGGCWTMHQAIKLGKPGLLIIVE